MKTRQFLAALLGLMASLSALAADSVIPVYQDDDFVANAAISTCSGCTKQMAITARYQFIFDGNYAHLYNELLSIGIKVTVYESSWTDAESGEMNFKVASSTRPLERWRRTNLGQRRVTKVSESADAIYAEASAGQLITIEFLQEPIAQSSDDFTVNVRRYSGETLLGSRSKAVSPAFFENKDGMWAQP